MSHSKDTVLKKLQSLFADPDLPAAQAFLNSPDTLQYNPLIAGKPVDEYIIYPKDIVSTWKARYENAKRKGFPLPGCAEFVRRLELIPDTTELMQVAFKRHKVVGLFWFDRNSGEPIGFVIAAGAETHKS